MSLTLTEQLLAPVTFNKGHLAEIGEDNQATGIAIGIIFISSIINGLIPVITGEQGGFTAFVSTVGGEAENVAIAFFIGFVFQLIILLIFSWVLSFVLRGFGGQASTSQALRMIGFATIWTIIGNLVGLAIPDLSVVFTLIFLAALSFGLSAFSGIGVISAFIAIIVAYILAIILVIILFFILIFAFLGAFLAGAGT